MAAELIYSPMLTERSRSSGYAVPMATRATSPGIPDERQDEGAGSTQPRPLADDEHAAGILTARERDLCTAIRGRRLVSFDLNGCQRIAEPHDYGIMNGRRRLFFFQVGGSSNSGKPLGWRVADLTKLSNLRPLNQHFAGPRPSLSGRHQKWQRLIASVSRPPF
jgi:hypothetical protein